MRFALILMVLTLIGAIGCFALYIATGQMRYRHYGLVAMKWVVMAGLVFFAMLIVARIL